MEKTIDPQALTQLLECCAQTGEAAGLGDYDDGATPFIRTFLEAVERYRAQGATPELLRLVAHLVTRQSLIAFGHARVALSFGDSRMSELFGIMEGILRKEGKASPSWRTMALLCRRLADVEASRTAGATPRLGARQDASLFELFDAEPYTHALALEDPGLIEMPEDESGTNGLVLLGDVCFAAGHLERAWACYNRRLPCVPQRRFAEFTERALAEGSVVLAANAAVHVHGIDRSYRLRAILARAMQLELTDGVKQICEQFGYYFKQGELLEAGIYLGMRAPWKSLTVLALARVSDRVLQYERLIIQHSEEASAALTSLPPAADGSPLGEVEQEALLTSFGDDALDRGDLQVAHACYLSAGATQHLSMLRLHAEAIGAKTLERLIFSSIGELIAAHRSESSETDSLQGDNLR